MGGGCDIPTRVVVMSMGTDVAVERRSGEDEQRCGE